MVQSTEARANTETGAQRSLQVTVGAVRRPRRPWPAARPAAPPRRAGCGWRQSRCAGSPCGCPPAPRTRPAPAPPPLPPQRWAGGTPGCGSGRPRAAPQARAANGGIWVGARRYPVAQQAALRPLNLPCPTCPRPKHLSRRLQRAAVDGWVGGAVQARQECGMQSHHMPVQPFNCDGHGRGLPPQLQSGGAGGGEGWALAACGSWCKSAAAARACPTTREYSPAQLRRRPPGCAPSPPPPSPSPNWQRRLSPPPKPRLHQVVEGEQRQHEGGGAALQRQVRHEANLRNAVAGGMVVVNPPGDRAA